MKPLRIYHTRSCWIWCRVDFVVSDKDWEQDPDLAATLERYSITMRAAVLYRAPSSPHDMPDRFHVRAHPNIPRDLVFNEAIYFLQTIKQMYEL